MENLLNKIKKSFKLAMAGKETVFNLIWWWGATAFFLSYFVVNKLILAIDYRFIDITISILAIIYFAWHFYVLKKCAPKKKKLTKEEKKQRKKEFGRRFLRKLLLQESITKWDPVVIVLVLDVFSMAHFISYI